jgi:hypothetical protein
MTLELSRVLVLRKGWSRLESVGPLHNKGVAYLNSRTSVVNISHEGILHIDEHGGFTDFEIITIPFGLMNCLFIGDLQEPNRLIISYLYPDNNTRYKTVVKSANNGAELWVCTFHRMRKRQTKTLLKRGPIIKMHD